MNFFFAMLAWLVIGVLLGVGLYLWAVKGIFWVMLLLIAALVAAVGKIGCASH